MGRNPTDVELNNIVNAFMSQLLASGSKLFQAAPNTIFAIAAGNDNSDNDAFADYPSGIPAENKIVVAATVGYKTLAEFSNYGATKVDVAAPGVAITSTAPANNYIQLSGTSQAAPFVTNVVAQIKDLNPNISLRDVIAIVMGTVDVKPWLKGKVRSSGIVNKERAKKAAILSNKINVTVAIIKARALVPDVVENNLINKSLMEKLDHKYVPRRTNLLRDFVR
jgi:subtilisin family serine protease